MTRSRSLPHLLGLALLLVSATPLWAQSTPPDWKPAGGGAGIQLYTREVPGQVLKAFKGTMAVDAPLAQVAATLADVSAMPEWFFLLRDARFFKGEHIDDSYIYLRLKGIWPVSPRDAVAHVRVTQDPQTMVIHVQLDGEEGLLPRQEGYVRIPTLHANWTLTPVSASRTDLEVSGSADPGGWIPVALANFLVTTLPYESLKKMRVHIAKPQYRDAETIYAKNPKLRELAARLRFPTPLAPPTPAPPP